MSIAPFLPTRPGHPGHASHAGHASAAVKPGQDAPGQPAQAGVDSALGFLAELAAAVGAVGPLGQQLPVPNALPDTSATGSGAQQSDLGPTRAGASPLLPLPAGGLAVGPVAPGAVVTGAVVTGSVTPAAVTVAQLGVAAGLLDAAAGPQNGSHDASGASSPFSGAPSTAGRAARAVPAAAPERHREPVAAERSPAMAADRAADASPGPTVPGSASSTSEASVPAPETSSPLTVAASGGVDVLGPSAMSTVSTVETADPGSQQTTAVLRQVFPEVTKVSATPGTHRLAITLHPDDLGEVRVTVVVRGDSVRVDVATDPTSGIARTALEHGAPELRRLLEATGANARVDFREFGAGSGLGSATDHSRQQQASAHQQAAQQQAGSHDADGRGRSAYASGTDAPTSPTSTDRTRRAIDPANPTSPTVGQSTDPTGSATSGVDRLI